MASSISEAKELTEASDNVGEDNSAAVSAHVPQSEVETATSTDACRKEEDTNHPLVRTVYSRETLLRFGPTLFTV